MSRVLLPLLSFCIAGAALAQSSQPPAPTLRTGTKLVIVDVTVTDKEHRPVHNLKQDNFVLLENNISQPLHSFEEHLPSSTAALQPVQPLPKLPPGVFTDYTPLPFQESGPVNILLIDRLNTPEENQTRLRAQLLDYLKTARPDKRIAIFGLTTQLVLLEGFTSDPGKLREVLQKKSNAMPSALQDPARATGGMAEMPSETILNSPLLDLTGGLDVMAANAQIFESVLASQQQLDRAKLTMEAMNALARYLVEIPGRKNLIWFSGSFPLELLPDPTAGETEFLNLDAVRAEFRETVSLLSRAQVSVYPVDARGLTILPNATVAGEGGMGEQFVPHGTNSEVPSGAQLMSNFIDKAMQQTFEENTTMRNLAYETGGRAFLNTNDLREAVGDALGDGANYYTLTYSPTNGNWNGDYRKIEIRLHDATYTLSYRRGYYADDPNTPPSVLDKLGSGRAVEAPLGAPRDFGSMHLALMHAGPEPSEILFTLRVTPLSTAAESALASGNEGSAGLKPPFLRYGLNFAADPRALAFTPSTDGGEHGAMEFVAFVYDIDGKLINAVGAPVKLDYTGDLYRQAMQHGIPFHEEISIPAKGQYFVRAAVHDLQNNHVGAVEVPIAAPRNPVAH